MKIRLLIFLGFISTCLASNSQVITGFESSDNIYRLRNNIPDSTALNWYFDSLKAINSNDILLTGYTFSSFYESTPNVYLEYSIDKREYKKLLSDSIGRFFIVIPFQNFESIHLRSNDNQFHSFDTLIHFPHGEKTHIPIKLLPRFNIVLRGRAYIGSLATEDIDVTIIHNSDTFRLKTLDCYTDNENYWNCLYKGMFKQIINFDNPEDSIHISYFKPGFKVFNVNMKVSEYDGTIMPAKLSYSAFLPKFPTHNLALKYAPPISNVWSVGINYTYLPHLGSFNRLAFGLEASMLITNYSTELNTFPNANSIPDTAYIKTSIDTPNNTGMIMPHITFWLTNPEKRFFSLYTGIGVPFAIPNNKVFIQPFIGSRIYLDINKSLLLELRYVNYEIDAIKYQFNNVGNSTRYSSKEGYSKLLFNIGLQVSF